MQMTLTPEQIATARAMRAGGATYPKIVVALGGDVSTATVRGHCLDVQGDGEARKRVDKPERQRKDGGVIRGFTEWEDQEIIAWVSPSPVPSRENMNQLASRMGRRRHSVAARIKTLTKHGRIAAD